MDFQAFGYLAGATIILLTVTTAIYKNFKDKTKISAIEKDMDEIKIEVKSHGDQINRLNSKADSGEMKTDRIEETIKTYGIQLQELIVITTRIDTALNGKNK